MAIKVMLDDPRVMEFVARARIKNLRPLRVRNAKFCLFVLRREPKFFVVACNSKGIYLGYPWSRKIARRVLYNLGGECRSLGYRRAVRKQGVYTPSEIYRPFEED